MKVDLFSIGPFTVHGYGLMIGIGVLCCVFMAMKRAKKYGLIEDAIVDIAIWGLIGGFLGAKLLFLIVEWKQFLKKAGRFPQNRQRLDGLRESESAEESRQHEGRRKR